MSKKIVVESKKISPIAGIHQMQNLGHLTNYAIYGLCEMMEDCDLDQAEVSRIREAFACVTRLIIETGNNIDKSQLFPAA
jgi:hypothetical protein